MKDPNIIFVVNPEFKQISLHPHKNHDFQRFPTENHSGILKTFFLFAHCLCICPFRIGKDSDGTNVAKRWFIQLVICFFVTVASLFTRVADVRRAFPSKDEEWNPVVYFRIFFSVCSLGLSLNAWWSLWRKSDRFVDVVEFIDSTKALPYLSTKIPLAKLAGLICFIYASLGSVSAFFGSELMESSEWTPDYWSKCLVLEARYQFFTGPESNCTLTNLDKMTDIPVIDHFLATFTGFGQLFKFLTSFYWDLFILYGVLSLWLPAAAFANGLKEDNDDTEEDERISEQRILDAAAQWPVLEEQYLSLKDLSDLINNAFGAMVFSYTFTSIFYYSINLDLFLLTTDVLVRIRLIVLYLGAVVLFILAADVCRQVGYLEMWLSEYADDEDKSNVPFHRLTVILNELSTNTIGVTGWNVFTITYSVVANMTSVLITYFIICVQFRKPNT